MRRGPTRFNFKRLDVYRESLDYFAWVLAVTGPLPWRARRLTDQAIGAALSVLGNVAEAGGRRPKPAEAAQHYRYALGSLHESGAYLDAIDALVDLDDDVYDRREEQLARIGAMLTRMMQLQTRRTPT